MEVRRFEAGDADLALEIIRTLKITDSELRRRLSAAELRHFLSRPENYLICATEDGGPAGYLVAYLLDRVDRAQPMMLLYEIAVAEALHRKGIGTAMIRLLKKYCREQNVMKMWVHTNRSNQAAMRLYQTTGGIADPAGDEITFLYTAEA
ncbi:MAG TPA: GNAT family N-acetyltransferase [Blastocatellia bacterium]|nr:GNAT family N-acetyltransferase [Blastocatellia bacterium]